MARAKIFKHGGSQAVRLPKEFRFEVDEVDIRKEGEEVVLAAPKPRRRTASEWQAFWAELDRLGGGDRFPERDQPDFDVRDLDC